MATESSASGFFSYADRRFHPSVVLGVVVFCVVLTILLHYRACSVWMALGIALVVGVLAGLLALIPKPKTK